MVGKPEKVRGRGRSVFFIVVSPERIRRIFEKAIQRKLNNERCREVYLDMEKRYAEALPDLAKFGAKMVFSDERRARPKSTSTKTMDYWRQFI